MSSSPTAPTSTTALWNSSTSPPVEILACGALAGHVRAIVERRGWPVAVRSLPAILHNRPRKIIVEAERAVVRARDAGRTVALAYADCGTYGALDELCARYGLRRLPGLHCYDVFAGPSRVAAMFEAEPGTYVLTDYLLRSFDRTVVAELGLDRYPELWPDYFGHYRRLVWLAQDPEPGLAAQAERVAARFGLPLTVVPTGAARLERELESLIAAEDKAGEDMWLLVQHPQKNVGGVPPTTNDGRGGPGARSGP